MLERQPPPRWQGFLLAAIAGGIGLLLGLGISYLVLQPRVHSSQVEVASLQSLLQDREARLDQAQQNLARQEGRIEELGQVKGERDRLQEDLQAARQEVQDLQSQVEEQQQRLADLAQVKQELAGKSEQVAALQGLVDHLAVDRLILAELRKELPEERQKAVDYWQTIKGLAAQSQPSLGSKADQVLGAVGGFFDWDEALQQGQFSSQEEANSMYFLLGANRYADLVQEFLEEALLVVINRLGAIAELTGAPEG